MNRYERWCEKNPEAAVDAEMATERKERKERLGGLRSGMAARMQQENGSFLDIDRSTDSPHLRGFSVDHVAPQITRQHVQEAFSRHVDYATHVREHIAALQELVRECAQRAATPRVPAQIRWHYLSTTLDKEAIDASLPRPGDFVTLPASRAETVAGLMDAGLMSANEARAVLMGEKV